MSRRSFSPRAVPLMLLALGSIVGPRAMCGQGVEPLRLLRPSVTIVGGAYGAGAASGGRHPLVAARAGHALSSWLLAEVGLGLTSAVRPVSRRVVPPSGPAFTTVDSFKVPLLMPEVQAQVQLPLGRVRPYAGVGGGLVVRAPGADFGDRFVRPSYFGAGGLRVDLGARLGLRGEVRLRGDRYPGARTVRATDQAVGLMWRF